MFDKSYLFNPYKLKTSSLEELVQVIDGLANQYRYTDLPQDVSFNINLENNLLLLYGEIISRLQEEADKLELQADIKEATLTYEYRQKWIKESLEKPPAMSYFEALAKQSAYDLRQKEISAKADLMRFKKAYEGVENKQNGLKKTLDVMKYEVV